MSPAAKPAPAPGPAPTTAPTITAPTITAGQLQELRSASLHLLGSFDEGATIEDLAMAALAATERHDHVIRALNDVRMGKVVPTDKHLRELAAQLRDASTAMLDGAQRIVKVLRAIERGRVPLRAV